jgi:hypothetical protein
MATPRKSCNGSGPPARLHVLHGDEHLAALVGHFIDLADEGMIEGRRRPRLPQQPSSRGSIVAKILREELERHLAIEAGVERKEDLSHASLAELLQDAVVGD